MKLTNSIVEHIFHNLGFLDARTNSLISETLLTDHTITYEDEEEHKLPVYACETRITQSQIVMAGVVFPSEGIRQEMAVVVHTQDCPIYGCYLWYESGSQPVESEGQILMSLKDNTWMDTTTFVQASFLAGMEHLRDLRQAFTVCKDAKPIYQSLVAFIKHIDQQNGN